MGADRAILVVATDDVHTDIEPLAVAKIWPKHVVEKSSPGIVLAGKQAIDNDMNATGQMLSALLGWSQATFASELDVDGDTQPSPAKLTAALQTIKVKMPTIVTVDLRLNEPRYASLPNIMKAKKKPLDEKTPADYGVDVTPRLSIVGTTEPEARKRGRSWLAPLTSWSRNSKKRGLYNGCSSDCRSCNGGELNVDATAKA